MDLDSAEFAIRVAQESGARFADARLEKITTSGFLLKNGVAESSSFDEICGIGIRVLVNSTLGFASTNILTREGVKKAVIAALRDAQSASRIRNNVILAKDKAYKAKYHVKQKIKFEDISPKEKIASLMDIEKAVLATKVKVPARYFSLTDSVEEKYYVNSEGSRILSSVPRLNFYFFLTHVDGQKCAQRYWQYGKAAGFEAMKEFKLPKLLAEDAIRMKKSVNTRLKVPKGELDVVVGPQITGIMVHESGGHPYEADRILGREAAQAGESFLSPRSIGLQLGSAAVSISDDPTIESSFGYYLYDDEGIKAGKKKLMENGKITSFLNSRESAAILGSAPNASSRARGFDREPIPRMSNTFVEKGELSEEELIEDVKNGVYIKTFTEWNIDDRRVNQKYVGSEAYLIKNGRLTGQVFAPTIEITTQALWSSIDAVGNNTEYHAGSCGKGEPMQGLAVWFGGPSMRIRGIKLK